MFQHIVTVWRIDRGCSRMLKHTKLDLIQQPSHGCCNIAVQSCYFIIPWQHVVSCMNMAVGLSRWFQQRCSSLSVHEAMNSLLQHAWTSLSTTLFKLASSTMFKLASATMFKPVNREKQVVRLYVCSRLCAAELTIGHLFFNDCCKA